ncbi:MAG: uncharacterized protein PWP23_627 [Candidatus Sumerlaeota bacterium]|nr:uncharacterized protein [Candidatus Sumerlaeota bacterium]
MSAAESQRSRALPGVRRRRWRGATTRFVSRITVHLAGRHYLRAQGTRVLKGLGVGVGYAAVIEPRLIERTHVEFQLPGLHRALDGYRIVHLTDIHYNLVAGRGFLTRVVDLANALDPDLVVLTGDFVTHDAGRVHGCFELLSGLQAPDGLLATRGNHDYRCGDEAFRRACESAGVRLLENEHLLVHPVRHRGPVVPREQEEAGILFGGVADLWEGLADPTRAFAGAPSGYPRILLSHNPLVADLLTRRHDVALQLSGHTHGGQIRPFNRPVALFSGGSTRYSAGVAQAAHTTVFISRGVGTSALHMRWNCRPEITLITLHPTNQ